MRDQADEILKLQPEWTSLNSPAMQRRGHLVRTEVAGWLEAQLPDLQALMPESIDDLQVEGRDATGRKSRIPWARVHSMSRSDSATLGFYVVYLFSAAGDRFYLSLMQGTTRWENGEFHPRPVEELQERVAWARDAAAASLSGNARLLNDIDLESTADLARGYERGNIAAFSYSAGAIPHDGELSADLRFMIAALADVYLAEDRSLDMPGEPAPEITDAVAIVEQVARPRAQSRSKRARIRLSGPERIAVERRAVRLTVEHLKSIGYKVKDVGATKSYDLHAKREDQDLYVEVKGTTSDGAEVVLTRNEVELNARQYPNTMLALVTGIELDRSGESSTATGGALRTIHAWRAETSALQPIAYRYAVPQIE